MLCLILFLLSSSWQKFSTHLFHLYTISALMKAVWPVVKMNGNNVLKPIYFTTWSEMILVFSNLQGFFHLGAPNRLISELWCFMNSGLSENKVNSVFTLGFPVIYKCLLSIHFDQSLRLLFLKEGIGLDNI